MIARQYPLSRKLDRFVRHRLNSRLRPAYSDRSSLWNINRGTRIRSNPSWPALVLPCRTLPNDMIVLIHDSDILAGCQTSGSSARMRDTSLSSCARLRVGFRHAFADVLGLEVRKNL